MMQFILYVCIVGVIINYLTNLIWKYMPQDKHIDKWVTGVSLSVLVILAFYVNEDKPIQVTIVSPTTNQLSAASTPASKDPMAEQPPSIIATPTETPTPITIANKQQAAAPDPEFKVQLLRGDSPLKIDDQINLSIALERGKNLDQAKRNVLIAFHFERFPGGNIIIFDNKKYWLPTEGAKTIDLEGIGAFQLTTRSPVLTDDACASITMIVKPIALKSKMLDR